jgi:hypothetical protein
MAGLGNADALYGQYDFADSDANPASIHESVFDPTAEFIQWDTGADVNAEDHECLLGGSDGSPFAPSNHRRVFPIGGQMLADLGYPVVLPFGIGANVMYSDQEFAVDQVQVGVGGLPPLPVALAEIPSLRSRSTSATVRYDCWVLPVLNIYGLTGYTSGVTTGEVVVGGVAGVPGLVRIPVRTEFEGPTYGGGFLAAVGYKKLFASVDWHYAEAHLDLADSSVATKTTSPRIGLNGSCGSLWVGATHEKIQERLTVSSQIVGPLSIDTITDYKTASPWNFVYGCRLLVKDHLELFVEHGFGGRNQVMGSVTGRF